MKKTTVFILIMLLWQDHASAQKRTTVALLDLEVTKDLPASTSPVLSNLIRQEFLRSKNYEILDRNNMSSILKEQDLSLSDACSGKDCAVQLGKLLAVEKMIYGSLSSLGKKYLINLQMVDVSTGKIEKIENESYVGAIEEIDVAAVRIAKKIIGEETIETANVYSIYVTSEPQGARVYVGDELLGSTPATITLPNDKKATVRLKAAAYQDWYQEVKPKKGEKLIVNATLLAAAKGEGDVSGRIRIYEVNQKKHGSALLWSWLTGYVGGGHFYAKSYKRGGIILLAGVSGFLLQDKSGGKTLFFAAYITDIIGSQFAVSSYNNKLKRDLDIGFIPDFQRKGIQVAISKTF